MYVPIRRDSASQDLILSSRRNAGHTPLRRSATMPYPTPNSLSPMHRLKRRAGGPPASPFPQPSFRLPPMEDEMDVDGDTTIAGPRASLTRPDFDGVGPEVGIDHQSTPLTLQTDPHLQDGNLETGDGNAQVLQDAAQAATQLEHKLASFRSKYAASWQILVTEAGKAGVSEDSLREKLEISEGRATSFQSECTTASEELNSARKRIKELMDQHNQDTRTWASTEQSNHEEIQRLKLELELKREQISQLEAEPDYALY
ncbi:hypothetical protein BV25DRAFT_1820251 [Artomyces pyxidatus]|uniref:Uncharacterized protein n=1 Tax=Artomyces pyxidatus TaxID=48021 RepID=A0ACB8TF63_9AGAM|nr:hypothetical protein BV25DRAFT_1820251 [Artomyces pyxidatus]